MPRTSKSEQSETTSFYTVTYDNATSGCACAFNSQGDIEIIMQATGEPGWHFVDLYPAIYEGSETRPNNYRFPQPPMRTTIRAKTCRGSATLSR